MTLDNSKLIAPFAPLVEDGDTFIYTELLDRGKRKGNNGHRLLKTFYHRSQEEFWEQWPTIKLVCDMTKIRACTRLAPKGFEAVGRLHTKMIVEAAMSNNWAGMKSLYNRACGTAPAKEKLWLFDVDIKNEATLDFEKWLKDEGVWVATIPSKKGLHYISKPVNVLHVQERWRASNITEEQLSLHKDNPTNLYIPDGAD